MDRTPLREGGVAVRSARLWIAALAPDSGEESVYEADYVELPKAAETSRSYESVDDLEQTIKDLEQEMYAAAQDLAFEEAAVLRDRIAALRKKIIFEIG